MKIWTRQQIEKFDEYTGTLFEKLQNFIEGNTNNKFIMSYRDYAMALVLYVTGSVDYYNSVMVENQEWNPHPLSLVYIEDNIKYGYINSDIINLDTTDNTRRFVSSSGSYISWGINYAPPYIYSWNGSNSSAPYADDLFFPIFPAEYPSWRGWPSWNGTGSPTTTYPKNSYGNKAPVFLCGQWFTITPTLAMIPSGSKLSIDGTEAIQCSMWKETYEDIKIFQLTNYKSYYGSMAPYLDKTVPESSISQCNVSINGNNIEFDTAANIAFGDTHFFLLYWSSPDVWNATHHNTASSGAAVTDFTIERGNHHNYFFEDRIDYIQYENAQPILKAKSRTHYDGSEDDSNLYDPIDPIFYPLSRLYGNLDEYDNNYAQGLSGYQSGFYFGYLNNSINYSEAFSTNYRDSSGNYPDVESVYGVCVSIKTIANNYLKPDIIYDYKKGPIVFPDMFPKTWADFSYYPNAPIDYIPYVYLVIGQLKANKRSGNSPRAKIIYMKYDTNYGQRGLDDIELISTILQPIEELWTKLNQDILRFVTPNFSFSTFFKLLAYQIESISEMFNSMLIHISHEKYISSGMYLNTSITNKLYASNIIDTQTAKEILSIEPISTDVSKHPWYQNLVYWKNPIDHGYDHYNFSNGNARMCAYARGVDPSTIHVQYIPGNPEYDDTISIYNPSNPATVKQTRDDSLLVGFRLLNKKIWTPSKLKLQFPVPTFDDIWSNSISVNQDYTLKFIFKDVMQNNIQKLDLYIPNGNYFISDAEYASRSSSGETTDGYLSPSIIKNMKMYQEYGEAAIIADCRMGGEYGVYFRVFEPDDPTLPTYDEFLSALEAQYASQISQGGKSRSDAYEDIRDAIDYQENYGGGFDTIDTRTISSKIVSIEEAWLGFTTYTYGTPVWKFNYGWLGGNTVALDEDLNMILEIRYGFKVNGAWYYQGFDPDVVKQNRYLYASSHLAGFETIKNYIIKQQYDHELYNDIDFALNGNVRFLAQTFTADFSSSVSTIDKIQCWVSRTGLANATVMLSIYNTYDNKPIGSPIKSSSPIDFNSIPEFPGDWISFNFPDNLHLENDVSKRYAIVLQSISHIKNELNTSTYLSWHFSKNNVSQYGISNVITYTDGATTAGSTYIKVEDASIFPSTETFFIAIEGDLYFVTSVDLTNNILHLSEYEYMGEYSTGHIDGTPPQDEYDEYYWLIYSISKYYSSGTPVYLVTFMPLDPENRWSMFQAESYGLSLYDWSLPEYSNHDASYRIHGVGDDIGVVRQVPWGEWFGDDLPSDYDEYADAFYIVPESAQYKLSGWGSTPYGSYLFSYGQSSNPIDGTILGGFNVSGHEDFPSENTIRVGTLNKVEGYWAINTKELDKSDVIKVLPQIKYNVQTGVYSYLPFYNNIFLTIGLVRADSSRKVVKKILKGYNHAYGTVNSMTGGSSTFTASGSPAWTTNQFVYKTIWITTGKMQGNKYTIIANTSNTITLIETPHMPFESGDEFIIIYSTEVARYVGIINGAPTHATDSTTITVSPDPSWTGTEGWDSDSFRLWVFNDNNYNGQSFEIRSYTSNTLTIELTYLSNGSGIAIIEYNVTDTIENPASYGTNGPISVDSEKFVRVDHMYISSTGFPTNYWDGPDGSDAFTIKTDVELDIEY